MTTLLTGTSPMLDSSPPMDVLRRVRATSKPRPRASPPRPPQHEPSSRERRQSSTSHPSSLQPTRPMAMARYSVG